MRRYGAEQVVVGQSARIPEEWLNAGTPTVGTVDGPWKIDVSKVSLRKDSAI